MDENRITGAATQLGGSIKDAFGRVTGDNSMRAEGKADQLSGQVQNAYGSARDTVRDGVQNANSWLDGSVGQYPLAGLLAVAAAGFVLARVLHR